MSESHQLIKRSASAFFAGTLLSRMSGLARDMAMAVAFGSGAEIAAFMVAYRLANLFRRLLGEGNLQAGFVPHYTQLKEEGPAFFRDTTYSLGLILLLLIALLEILLWGAKSVVSIEWIEVIDLTMLMVPGLFFICLYGLNCALLQCHQKYFLPAVSPVAFNLVWIIAVLLWPDVRTLSFVMTGAFFCQWLMTAFVGTEPLSLLQWLQPKLFSTEFKNLTKPLLLGIVGVSATQLNSALDAIFSRVADPEGPAYLWYAIRLEQLPLALFGVALSGALLPPLSRTADPIVRRDLLDKALRASGALMIVCSFAIFALGAPSIHLLYGHGQFSSHGLMQTTYCLWGYGLGLIPSVFILVLACSLYAEKNYKTPMRASLASVGANIFLNALFVYVFKWGAFSIAMATSLSAYLNMALLANSAFSLQTFRFFAQVVFISCLGVLCAAGAQWLLGSLSHEPVWQGIHFFLFSTSYFAPIGLAYLYCRSKYFLF